MMSTDINDVIVHTGMTDWKPLVESGVDYKGVYMMGLRFNEAQKRHDSILLKFEAGASYPYHNHPAGEQLLVLEGACEIENTLLQKGDYLYTPPNYKHAVKSHTGCTLFLNIPEEVELIDKAPEQ